MQKGNVLITVGRRIPTHFSGLGWLLGMGVLVVACSDSASVEMPGAAGTTAGPAQVMAPATADPAGARSATSVVMAGDMASAAPVGMSPAPVAGTTVTAPMAGMAPTTDLAAMPGAAGMDPVAMPGAPGMDPAAMPGAGMEPAAMPGAGMDPAAMEPVAAGPLALPSPDEVGPYEVVEEENVGQGFENAIAANDRGDGQGCFSFINSFGQGAEESREYAAIPEGHDMALYTLYRPAEIPEGVKMPALSWANGTCAHPVGYAAMIRHLVSHGFIVVAAHSRYTGSGEAQIRGLDWMVAQNEDPESALYGHIDTEALGIFGHSQGSGSTSMAARDSRVASIVYMHGTANNAQVPAFYLTSDLEVLFVRAGYDANRGPAAFGKLENSDHITMMVEHERMAPEVTAWFRYTLLGDMEAATWFVGSDCLLCNDSEWDFDAKNLQ